MAPYLLGVESVDVGKGDIDSCLRLFGQDHQRLMERRLHDDIEWFVLGSRLSGSFALVKCGDVVEQGGVALVSSASAQINFQNKNE